MSISFSQIPQIISIEESPQVRNNSYQKFDVVKMKIPSLHDKFQTRLKNEEARLQSNNNQLMQQLEENKKQFEQEQIKQHKAQIKQRKLQDYQLMKSMSNGYPKHPRGFRKANKELEVFKERGFLLPDIDNAKQMREEQNQYENERKKYLKTKAHSTITEPWNPTKTIANYFDNTHLMKNVEENTQVTQNYHETSKKNGIKSQNNIQSLGDIPMNIQENEVKQVKKREQKQGKNGHSMSQSYLEQVVMKPTSSNNLMLFQQQLAEEKSQIKNIRSMNSLASIKKSQQSIYNMSTLDVGQQKNKQWINAYHQKEIFHRPLYNNLDIKLQGNNPHFKPFKPTKTQGYDFNQYISLEAGERDSKSANMKRMQEENIHFENEPMEIKPPKQYSSLQKIDNF